MAATNVTLCGVIDTALDKAETDSSVPLTLRGVIAIRPFRKLWIAQAVSILGDFVRLYLRFRWRWCSACTARRAM